MRRLRGWPAAPHWRMSAAAMPSTGPQTRATSAAVGASAQWGPSNRAPVRESQGIPSASAASPALRRLSTMTTDEPLWMIAVRSAVRARARTWAGLPPGRLPREGARTSSMSGSSWTTTETPAHCSMGWVSQPGAPWSTHVWPAAVSRRATATTRLAWAKLRDRQNSATVATQSSSPSISSRSLAASPTPLRMSVTSSRSSSPST